MEKTTSTRSRVAALVFFISLFLSPVFYAQTVLHQATFESGTDGWTLVTNAYRVSNGTWAAENNYSIMIRRNVGHNTVVVLRCPGTITVL